jgi:hypothetical protein
MTDFLSTYPTLAHFGVVPFGTGSGDECAAASAADIPTVGVDIPSGDTDADLQAAANAVSQKIQGLTAAGATPTGAALQALSEYAPLLGTDQDDFVLLLTDGLPNCNANNPNTCADAAACQCTLSSCSGQFCSTGCLDQTGAVGAVAALRQAQIKTIVIGFGADVAGATGSAFSVLNAMADAGGFGRPCQTNADCPGGDTCNTSSKQCTATRFYQAEDGAQLGEALAAISGNIPTDPCTVLLDTTPPAPDLLSVVVNGNPVLPGDPNTWELDPGNRVHFMGKLCADLQSATPANPVQLDLRVIEML